MVDWPDSQRGGRNWWHFRQKHFMCSHVVSRLLQRRRYFLPTLLLVLLAVGITMLPIIRHLRVRDKRIVLEGNPPHHHPAVVEVTLFIRQILHWIIFCQDKHHQSIFNNSSKDKIEPNYHQHHPYSSLIVGMLNIIVSLVTRRCLQFDLKSKRRVMVWLFHHLVRLYWLLLLLKVEVEIWIMMPTALMAKMSSRR